MIILDTNVLSELAKSVAHRAVLAWAAGSSGTTLATTAITEAEMRFGIASLPDGRRQRDLLLAFQAVFRRVVGGRVLPFDRAATQPFADFLRLRQATGRPVGTSDAMIAAIALAGGATAIATRNTADFADCELALIDPWHGAHT